MSINIFDINGNNYIESINLNSSSKETVPSTYAVKQELMNYAYVLRGRTDTKDYCEINLKDFGRFAGVMLITTNYGGGAVYAVTYMPAGSNTDFIYQKLYGNLAAHLNLQFAYDKNTQILRVNGLHPWASVDILTPKMIL